MPPQSNPPCLKIASWNVNSLRVRLGQVIDWLTTHDPYILALQETKLEDAHFPLQAFKDIGYHACFSGQKTYNGVAVLSRRPLRLIANHLPGLSDPQQRLLAVEDNGLCLLNLYVPNGSEPGSDKYQYKLQWLTHLHQYIKSLLPRGPYLLALGDFNIAPQDRDVHDPEAWQGKILVSEPEREAFSQLLELGLQDCFRLFRQEKDSFSWWDYRAAAFRRNRGLRIDHILTNEALARHCHACYIDKGPRGLTRPSDHTPVVAEFALPCPN